MKVFLANVSADTLPRAFPASPFRAVTGPGSPRYTEPMSISAFLEELADPTTPLKTGRLSRLSNLDEDDRSSLAERWHDLSPERRAMVLERLTELAEDNPELDFDAVFLTALGDDDPTLRRLAIDGLWEHEDRGLIAPLIDLLLRDPSAEVRASAALALGRFVLLGEFGDLRPSDFVRVTDALRAVVTDVTEPPEVRGRALESVGGCSQIWARDLIEEAYASGEERMVASALHAMGRSADTYWLGTLIQELESGDPSLRFEAATALGALEDEEAVPALADRLDDEDWEVALAAIQALGEIGGGDAVAALRSRLEDDDERVRDAVAEALEQAEFGNDPMGMRLS